MWMGNTHDKAYEINNQEAKKVYLKKAKNHAVF